MFDAPPPPWNPAPVVHESPANPQAGPLDLASASLGQEGTELQLEVTTRGAWKPSQLDHRGPRALCLTLAYGTTKTALCVAATGPARRSCAASRSSRPAGRPGSPRPRRTRDAHSRPRSLPSDVGLPFGPFKWSVVSSWNGGVDQMPRGQGARPPARRARLLRRGRPRHRDAPARTRCCERRDAHPRRGAVDARTRRVPRTSHVGLVYPCYFGVATDRAQGTVALLGDSHAEHWRAAIEVVAQSKRWRGISLSRYGCPFNTRGRQAAHGSGDRRMPSLASGRSGAFLAEHEEIHTVFVAARASAEFARDPANGAREALRSLPKSVRRIYVLRATPETFGSEAGCVDRRRRARVTIGSTCALPAPHALLADPQLRAAGGRVKVLDFTTYLCDASKCPSVIGGVLVRKDGTSPHAGVRAAPSGRSCCARSAERRDRRRGFATRAPGVDAITPPRRERRSDRISLSLTVQGVAAAHAPKRDLHPRRPRAPAPATRRRRGGRVPRRGDRPAAEPLRRGHRPPAPRGPAPRRGGRGHRADREGATRRPTTTRWPSAGAAGGRRVGLP